MPINHCTQEVNHQQRCSWQKHAIPSTIRDRGEFTEERPLLLITLPDLTPRARRCPSQGELTTIHLLLLRSPGGKHFAIGEQDRKLYYDFYCTFCTRPKPKEAPKQRRRIHLEPRRIVGTSIICYNIMAFQYCYWIACSWFPLVNLTF